MFVRLKAKNSLCWAESLDLFVALISNYRTVSSPQTTLNCFIIIYCFFFTFLPFLISYGNFCVMINLNVKLFQYLDRKNYVNHNNDFRAENLDLGHESTIERSLRLNVLCEYLYHPHHQQQHHYHYHYQWFTDPQLKRVFV